MRKRDPESRFQKSYRLVKTFLQYGYILKNLTIFIPNMLLAFNFENSVKGIETYFQLKRVEV